MIIAQQQINKLRDQLSLICEEVKNAAFDCDAVARESIVSVGEARTWKSMAHRLRGIIEKVRQ